MTAEEDLRLVPDLAEDASVLDLLADLAKTSPADHRVGQGVVGLVLAAVDRDRALNRTGL